MKARVRENLHNCIQKYLSRLFLLLDNSYGPLSILFFFLFLTKFLTKVQS